MEITCHRCHQTVEAENCYCPTCGLPQLVYATDSPAAQAQPEHWDETVRDAATIDWKPALRVALLMAAPAGVMCSMFSPLGLGGWILMAASAAWAVSLYMRSQRPAWLTIGAGARIGLVTGLLGAWLAFGISGGDLFVKRYLLHQSTQMDAEWKANVDLSQQLTQQWVTQMGMADSAQLQAQRNWMLSPEGHAGLAVFSFASNSIFIILFGIAGGATGARLRARSRKPEI